jgi:hypothetical protein
VHASGVRAPLSLPYSGGALLQLLLGPAITPNADRAAHTLSSLLDVCVTNAPTVFSRFPGFAMPSSTGLSERFKEQGYGGNELGFYPDLLN